MRKGKVSKKAIAKIKVKKVQERRKPNNHGMGAPMAHAVRIMMKRKAVQSGIDSNDYYDDE